MTITLPSDMAAMVKGAVEAGDYAIWAKAEYVISTARGLSNWDGSY